MMLSMDGGPKLQRLLQKLMQKMRGHAMGNGRAVRNLLEKAKRRQALRLQTVPGCSAWSIGASVMFAVALWDVFRGVQ